MVFSAKIASDGDDWLTTLQQVYEIIPEAVEQYARRELRPFVSQRVDKTLRREPGASNSPVRWEPSRNAGDAGKTPNTRWGYYSRQKAAYFATDGFGHGIPYKRTGQYVKGWKVRGVYKQGLASISVSHDWKGTQYVGGNRQSQQHKLTGWANAPDEMQVLVIELEERVRVGLPIVINQAFRELDR